MCCINILSFYGICINLEHTVKVTLYVQKLSQLLIHYSLCSQDKYERIKVLKVVFVFNWGIIFLTYHMTKIKIIFRKLPYAFRFQKDSCISAFSSFFLTSKFFKLEGIFKSVFIF